MITLDFSPVQALPDAEIRSAGPVSSALLDRGITSFHQAAASVADLPYGFNADSERALVLLEDGFGTCATKHGLIALLAAELGLPVARWEGFYALTDRVVTGVDPILRAAGLDYLPRTHCFLASGSTYVDLTEGNCTGKNGPILDYLEVFAVAPEPTRAGTDTLYRRFYAGLCDRDPAFGRIGVEGLLALLKECSAVNAALCRLR